MEQIIKVVLAIIFGLAVLAKLSGKTKDVFEKAGYSLPFMYAIAIIEVVLAVGLFTLYDSWSAIGLLTIMAGAIITLMRQRVTPAKYLMAVVTSVLLTTLVVISQHPI